MTVYIAKSIDFVGFHAKTLILQRYYKYYLFYYNIKKRKEYFVKKLRIKNEKMININVNRKMFLRKVFKKMDENDIKFKRIQIKIEKYL